MIMSDVMNCWRDAQTLYPLGHMAPQSFAMIPRNYDIDCELIMLA